MGYDDTERPGASITDRIVDIFIKRQHKGDLLTLFWQPATVM